MTGPSTMFTCRRLTKRFKRQAALLAVDWDVSAGHIVGLLGSNGAGKSTLLRHMIGLYLPTRGTCETLGCDTAKLGPAQLARIGYVHQEGELLDWMRVEQLIRYVRAYYAHWNQALVEQYISDFAIDLRPRVGTLSPGQRQKLAILLAIGHEPDLLILDEPASALDPLARSAFLDLLVELIQQEGRTIVISSHILSDVEKVIDHVTIMDQGRIREDCSFDQLQEHYAGVLVTALDQDLPQYTAPAGVALLERTARTMRLRVEAQALDTLNQQAGQWHASLETHTLPLEQLYELVIRRAPGTHRPKEVA